MPVIKTKRLIIQAMSREEMTAKIAGNAADASSYTRHLARAEEQSGGDERKPEWLFSTHWKILLKPAKDSPKDVVPNQIGDLYFKGKPENGSVTIGYLISESSRKKGYGSEAVAAMVQWAESHEDVFFVDADVESDNTASQKLLEKCKFGKHGVDEESGRILYTHKKTVVSYLAVFMLFGMSIGISLGSSQGNMAIGMCLGIAIGLGLGTALDSSQKQKLKNWEELRDRKQ